MECPCLPCRGLLTETGNFYYEVIVRELGEEGREIPVTIPVGERQYSDEEAEALYDAVFPELTERVLGGNESLEAVRSDLDLVRVLEPYGLTVRWESENVERVDTFGTVVNSGVPGGGRTGLVKSCLNGRGSYAGIRDSGDL